MYTENKSIDGLTAITPTTDDLVVTMDQSEVGVAKSSTLLSIYNLFKTTYDTVYAKYLGDADFYKYSIVTSVASGNLTVALKNYEGNDPTASKPVKIQIGGVIRTITSALSFTSTGGGGNYCNAGSAELATKEIDWFLIAVYDSVAGAVKLIGRRIGDAITLGNVVYSFTDERGFIGNVSGIINNTPADPVVNIGRFNATLSAGLAWSIPATSVIINSPCYETRTLDILPTPSASGSMTWTSTTITTAKYKIVGNVVTETFNVVGTTGGTDSLGLYLSGAFTSLFNTYGCGYVNINGTYLNVVSQKAGGNTQIYKGDFSNYGLGVNREVFVTISYTI